MKKNKNREFWAKLRARAVGKKNKWEKYGKRGSLEGRLNKILCISGRENI